MMHKIGFNITILCVVAILCVTILELFAMANNINGVALAGSIGVIVGLPTAIITRLITKKNME